MGRVSIMSKKKKGEKSFYQQPLTFTSPNIGSQKVIGYLICWLLFPLSTVLTKSRTEHLMESYN